MAFSVIRFSWDYFASLRFPFLRGPSAIMKQNRRPAAQKRRFLYAVDPYESKLSTARRHTKNLATLLRDFALIVIRLGFEPKTHSLEGCCSIQLSYRTDPYLFLTYSGTDVKSGCKDSDYFWICNKMFCSTPFLLNVMDVLAVFGSLEVVIV